MANKVRKQNSVIKYIKYIAEFNGMEVLTKKQDPYAKPGGKKFLPDVTASRRKGKEKIIFEVEATVNNNTIYKSLVSLLNALKSECTSTYLVVPNLKVKFADDCFAHLKSIIKHFSKSTKGANPKIKLKILSFTDIEKDYKKVEKYAHNGRKGQPPKCSYFTRA